VPQKTLLFGVNATDQTTFALLALLILGVALLACYPGMPGDKGRSSSGPQI